MTTEPVTGDVLHPLPPVQVGDETVHVDEARPVAAVVAADGATRFVTWPDAPLPPLSTQASAFAVDGAFWVVYVEDSDDEVESEQPRTIAVRVRLDGSWEAVDVGALTLIGVAADAVWATPTPSVSIEEDDEDEEDDDLGDFVEGPIAGVDYDADAPIEAFDEFDPHARSFSSDDDDDDDDDDVDVDDVDADLHSEEFGDARPESDTDDLPDLATLAADGESYGWFVGTPFDDSDDDVPLLSPPPPPQPTGPVTLSRLHVDGTVVQVRVDHVVSEIDETADGVRITYHPTGPIGTLEDRGRSVRYDYPLERIDFDLAEGLPEAVVTSDHDPVALPLEGWDTVDPAPTTDTAFDLTGVHGADWRLREQDPAVIAKAVESIRSALTALAEPDLVWTRADDRWHRVESAYRDVTVTIARSWPLTEVVATFRYRSRGDTAFRVRVPVFDGAGRPIVHQYLTVYLTEELDTLDRGRLRPGPDGFVDLDGGR